MNYSCTPNLKISAWKSSDLKEKNEWVVKKSELKKNDWINKRGKGWQLVRLEP